MAAIQVYIISKTMRTGLTHALSLVAQLYFSTRFNVNLTECVWFSLFCFERKVKGLKASGYTYNNMCMCMGLLRIGYLSLSVVSFSGGSHFSWDLASEEAAEIDYDHLWEKKPEFKWKISRRNLEDFEEVAMIMVNPELCVFVYFCYLVLHEPTKRKT